MQEMCKHLHRHHSLLNLLEWDTSTMLLQVGLLHTEDVVVNTCIYHLAVMVFTVMVFPITIVSSKIGTRNIQRSVQRKSKVLMGPSTRPVENTP